MTLPEPAALPRHGSTADHPLAGMLTRACAGGFPPADGRVEVLPPYPPGAVEWVVSFTGHAVIMTAADPEAVLAQRPDGYGEALSPRFLLWLAGAQGTVGCQDAVLMARGRSGGGLPRCDDLTDHPRVRLARSLRTDVRVHGDERGFVTVGTGLAGLPEVSVEVTAEHGRGHGRALIAAALALVADGEPVVAQVTPGNARSLRALMSAGFVPIGSAVSIRPQGRADA